MGRRPCCEKVGLNWGPWIVEEDVKLTNLILNHGIHCKRIVPKLAGVQRCEKSCRLKWVNYLRPDLKRGAISRAEEDQIIQLHSHYGNMWSKIASHFTSRTDKEIKNHWNTRIKKKLKQLGLDPRTHKPIEDQHHYNVKKPSSSFTRNYIRMSVAKESKEEEDEEMSEACSNQSSSSSNETYHF